MSEFFFLIAPVILLGIAFILIIFALSRIVKNDAIDKNVKVLWILIILLMPFVGAIAYLLTNKNILK